jgi:hypothetical protein
VRAQEWRAGAQVGRIEYEGSAAGSARTGTSLALSLARTSARDWLSLTAGVPLQDQPAWLVGALWKQWRQAGEWGVGLDVSGHGFVQHDVGADDAEPLPPLTEATPNQSGGGGGGEASALAFAGRGPFQLEMRGGAAGVTSDIGEVRTSRLLPTVTGRLSADVLPVQVALEGRRWWDPDSGGHTYAGASAQLAKRSWQIWASAGSWLAGGSSDPLLAAGGTLAVGSRLQIEGSWREPTFDPLYGSTTSRSFALGASVRVGGSDAVRAPVPARYENGQAVIRLPGTGIQGVPRIAGDFTNWEPQPMQARADGWEFAALLQPGVYSYAFVDEQGQWFVPEDTPGRKSDDMGGYQAVLIVGLR